MAWNRQLLAVAGAGLLGLAALTGCKSDEQRALDQAKAQAAATNTAQQIQYIDKNGDTVTTTVQPPAAGQVQQVTTNITPPPPGPPPSATKPVITPAGIAPQSTVSAAPVDQNSATLTGPSTVTTAAPVPAGSANTQTPAAAPGTAPSQSPAPAIDLTVPAGTELAIRINQHISVKHAHAGDRFTGEVVEPVSNNGAVAIPRGTPVFGRIDEAHRRGHFKGRSVLELRLTSMQLNGNRYELDTHDTVRTKKGKGKRSSAFIGGLTGAGMLIGGVASGGVGLAIGAASGAGAGTLLAGATGNRDIEIPAESIMHFRLADDLVVQNP